jgi:Chagasin family peptidase inhibitor I42
VLRPLYTSHGSVGSVSQSCPVEPRVKKIGPRISPGPDPIGTGYIRPCLQFVHSVTLIAAVNKWPLQPSVAGWFNAASSGVGVTRLLIIDERRITLSRLNRSRTTQGGAVGSGGHVVFTFKGKKAGIGEVTLKYWRHFEGDKSITNRFRLRLHTRE